MRWRGRLAQAWIAAALVACGCVSKASTLNALPPIPDPPTAAVTRSQKPDTPSHEGTTVCLLNLPVERPAEASKASPTATIRAVVNGEPILNEEVMLIARMGGQLYGARTDKEREEVIKQALQSIIDREVVLQDAISKLEKGGKRGTDLLHQIEKMASDEFERRYMRTMMKEKHLTRPELEAMMREHGIPLEVMRRYWERNFMATEYLKSRIEQYISRIGHTEISGYYTSHREEFTQPDSVDWQDIFLDATRHASREAAQQFAQSLVQRTRDGEDFAELSARFDNGTSGPYRKGAGEGHKHGEIRPVEAESVLFRMKEGDMEIIERPSGFHVIRLVRRQYAGPIPFDAKVQKEIRDKLRMQVFLRERDSIVRDLKRRAVIDIATK